MSFLKYYQGINPGKKRKIATSSEEEKKLKQQKYEEHRPERKFSHKWLVGCPWLMYDKSAMFCNWCIDYNNQTCIRLTEAKDKTHTIKDITYTILNNTEN
jgi:phage protein D